MRRIDAVQRPPGGGHRGHRPEHALSITEYSDSGDRGRTVGDSDGHIGQHLPRRVNPHAAVGVRQSTVERVDQAAVCSAISRSIPSPACETTPLPSALTFNRRTDPLDFT